LPNAIDTPVSEAVAALRRTGAQSRRVTPNAGLRMAPYSGPTTVWELTIKTMLGKLSVPADFSKRLSTQGLIPLSITAEHAEAIRDFPELVRHDPFDRLLVAQAACAGLRLLTADQILLGLGRDFIDASR
jgi:hypothetical protein